MASDNRVTEGKMPYLVDEANATTTYMTWYGNNPKKVVRIKKTGTVTETASAVINWDDRTTHTTWRAVNGYN